MITEISIFISIINVIEETETMKMLAIKKITRSQNASEEILNDVIK